MQKDRIRFVSAQPDHRHFVWQTRVYLHNYTSLGIPLRHCVALFGVEAVGSPTPELCALREDFPNADIRIYRDTRDADGRAYPPSIQPHLIRKALDDSPEWEAAPAFFHDCDVAFRRLPDFDRMLREHPRACVLSDSRDYVGFEHLHGLCEKIRAEKPEIPVDDLILAMCDVVGIDPRVVRENEAGSGGAQYLLQGVGRPYWEKVYRDSVALRRLFDDYVRRHGLEKEPKEYVQVWTAGMWAYLWNLWLEGMETVIHPEMKFLFSGAVSAEAAPILHMAGLQHELKHSHFDKQDWWELDPVETLRRQPYVFDHLPAGTVAREYATLIREAAGLGTRALEPLRPARTWRVLAWRTEGGKGVWDVERLRLRFEPGVSVVGHFDSGCAGPGYEAAHAFDDDRGTFWGGRAESLPGRRPCFYLGVDLDRPAVPEKIEISQREGPHAARVAIVQYSLGGGDWATGHVARLDPSLAGQTVLYRSEKGHAACGWRLVARETSSGFGWDVRRLRFLRDAEEETGTPSSSDFAHPHDPPQYGAPNAFRDDASYWGGRADATERFWLGIESTRGLAVNRFVLEQGADHWAPRVELQAQGADGRWQTLRHVENLGPGVNDVLVFEIADRSAWTRPHLESRDRSRRARLAR